MYIYVLPHDQINIFHHVYLQETIIQSHHVQDYPNQVYILLDELH